MCPRSATLPCRFRCGKYEQPDWGSRPVASPRSRPSALGRHHLRQLKPMVAATASGQQACTRARYARTETPFSSAVFSHSSSGLGDMSRVPSVAALSPDQPRRRRALNVLKAIPFSSATGQAGRPLSNSARLSLFRFSNAPRSNGNSTCSHRTVQSLVPSSASANSTTLEAVQTLALAQALVRSTAA